MDSPQILLIGIDGVYNYGCEAIVRGTEKIVRTVRPTAEIIYASRRPTDDINRLKGTQVKIIERKCRGRYSAQNVFRKLVSMTGFEWHPRTDFLNMLNGVNAIFSIGGDIYTLYPNGNFNRSLPKLGDFAESQDIRYILWGASVGPFNENPKAERFFRRHLSKISMITARETATESYLKELGIFNNVISCADPAYVVAPEVTANGTFANGLTIGINLSPLSIRHSKYSLDEFIQVQSKSIQELTKVLNARILLIPHVVCDFMESDDDLRYLRRVKQAIAPKYQKVVTLLNDDIGFVGTKKKLIKCSLVIASRMHCAINALAAHVPTILIAYSRKAVGMCQYVYGNDNWVIPLNKFGSNHTLKKIRLMIEQQKQIREYLSTRIPEIQQDAYKPLQMLKEIL
jgi:colanic acid/amylovoran biosynthesis protein